FPRTSTLGQTRATRVPTVSAGPSPAASGPSSPTPSDAAAAVLHLPERRNRGGGRQAYCRGRPRGNGRGRRHGPVPEYEAAAVRAEGARGPPGDPRPLADLRRSRQGDDGGGRGDAGGSRRPPGDRGGLPRARACGRRG